MLGLVEVLHDEESELNNEQQEETHEGVVSAMKSIPTPIGPIELIKDLKRIYAHISFIDLLKKFSISPFGPPKGNRIKVPGPNYSST